MKVAFDEHIPLAMVRAFQTFASERQLRHLSSGLVIESARDYAPKDGDGDFQRGSDVPWIRRFAKAGGRIIISGDTNMMREPHERLALIESGMIVFFFSSKWSGWKFFRKCSLLLHWWPDIASRAKRAKKGTFWRIPSNWNEKGRLEAVSTEDRKLVKITSQKAAQGKVAAKRRAKRSNQSPAQGSFDFKARSSRPPR